MNSDRIKRYALTGAVIWLAACGSIRLMAQTHAEKAEQIMNDESYLYGYGSGDDINSARKAALDELMSKISVSLTSTMNIQEEEVVKDGNLTATSNVQLVLNSYTHATLTNAESLVIEEGVPVKVLQYMKRSELAKIFEQRTDLLMDYVRTAERCEAARKIDDALKYNYWALCLLKSLQYPNEVRHEGQTLVSLLPQRISDILADLQVSIAGRDGSDVELYMTYKNEPVASVEYSYFDGRSWSPVYAAKDGVGMMDLHEDTDPSSVQLKYEYEYEGEAHINRDVESVIHIFRFAPFKHSQVPLVNNQKKKLQVDKSAAKLYRGTVLSSSKVSSSEPMKVSDDYEKTVSSVIDAVKTAGYEKTRESFTEDGWQMFDKLLHYGNAKLVPVDNTYAFYGLQDQIVCRSIPMQFAFANNTRKFIEPVTLTFNQDKQIDCVSFGLGEEANKDIFNQGYGQWSEEAKMIIATFLENYKTAFALKRLDYIESIFDEDALIITGHVIKKLENNSMMSENTSMTIDDSNELVKYTKRDKKDYIRHLKRCFASNEFINIKFTNNDIVKMGVGGELYGIQIHQDYYSSTYGDTGYLFLLVDLNDPKQPIIKVRTWQPNRDPNVNSRLPKDHPDYGIVGPGNF